MTGRLNIWLLLLLAVCVLSVWFGRDLVRRDPAGPEATAARPEEIAGEPIVRETPVHLVVLNGTDRTGLAREVSLLLGRAGCVAERVGNADGRRVAETILVNRRLTAGEAAALARRLGGLTVLTEWDARGSEDAVLVLGGDWARLTEALAAEERDRR